MIRLARRGITRGETVLFVTSVVGLALALLVAAWGVLSWVGDTEPVQTAGVPILAPAVAVGVAVIGLFWMLWGQALVMLRGSATLSVPRVLCSGVLAYVAWCVVGSLAGMAVRDTWVSPFAWVFAAIWAGAVVLFWALLARRLFTDAAVLRWPWENRVSGD